MTLLDFFRKCSDNKLDIEAHYNNDPLQVKVIELRMYTRIGETTHGKLLIITRRMLVDDNQVELSNLLESAFQEFKSLT